MLSEGTRIELTIVIVETHCRVGLGEPLIRTWLGIGFEVSVVPLYSRAIAGVVLVGQGPIGNVLLGAGRHRLVAFATIAEAVADLALGLVLVRRVGMWGVVGGTAIPVVA